MATKATKRHSVVSLFAGCGGFDLGIRGGFDVLGKRYKRLPFDLHWANDFNPKACETYGRNLGEHIRCGDIREILKEPTAYGFPSSADVVAGGFPCQAFSHAGKRLGFDDPRGQLYLSMIETVRRLQPKVFIAENVRGLLTHGGGETFKTILSDFNSLGYTLTWSLYKAKEYGVPQTRERVIVVGTRAGLPTFEHPAIATPTPITAKQALSDLESVEWGAVANHEWAKCKKNKGQGNGTIKADAPAPTMRAEHHGNIEFHYSLPRRLSAREAARIQTFPDTFEFLRCTGDAYRQIGNAVPPVLGWHVAKSLAEYLEKNGAGPGK
jgi:DNA (cytosine-5)-methyltransferase 1